MKTETLNKGSMKTIDQRIDELKNGHSLQLSTFSGVSVSCQKSGDGKLLRFVRETKNISIVFRTVKA